eukprot:gene9444-6627_t
MSSSSHPLALTSPFMVMVYFETIYEQIRNVLVDVTEYADLVVQNEHSRNGIVNAMEDVCHAFKVQCPTFPSAPSIDHLLPRRYRAYALAVQHAAERPQNFRRVCEAKILSPLRHLMQQLWDLMHSGALDGGELSMPRFQAFDQPAAGPDATGTDAAAPSVPEIAAAANKTLARIIQRFLRLHVAQVTHVIACWTPEEGSGGQQATTGAAASPAECAEALSAVASAPNAPPPRQPLALSSREHQQVRLAAAGSNKSDSVAMSSSTNSISRTASMSSVECGGEHYSREGAIHRLRVAMSKSSFDFDRLIHVCTCAVRNITQLTQDIVNSDVEEMRPMMVTMDRISKALNNFIYVEYSWFFFDLESYLVKPLAQLTRNVPFFTRVARRIRSNSKHRSRSASVRANSADNTNAPPVMHRLSAAHEIRSSGRKGAPQNNNNFLATFFSKDTGIMTEHSSQEVLRLSAEDTSAVEKSQSVKEQEQERVRRDVLQIHSALSRVSIKYLHAFGKCFYVDEPRGVRGRHTAATATARTCSLGLHDVKNREEEETQWMSEWNMKYIDELCPIETYSIFSFFFFFFRFRALFHFFSAVVALYEHTAVSPSHFPYTIALFFSCDGSLGILISLCKKTSFFFFLVFNFSNVRF